MSTGEIHLSEEKYLFTFQDETQILVFREFIEKYPQLPFYDIIKHSEKYEDGSYYIDMLPLHMEKVIQFLNDDNIDISLMNLKDSFDLYSTLYEYSIFINDEKQNNLFYHVKELFIKFLNEHKYCVCLEYSYMNDNCYSIPMELFNSEKKEIHINGLITPKRKDELLYYSLLFKIINVIRVKIEYPYASNIPLEYICPSCIKDIFPSLKEIWITVVTYYKKSGELLNPNTDEYMNEYHCYCCRYGYIQAYKYRNENCYYYGEYETYRYNEITTKEINRNIYSNELYESYDKRRQHYKLPKLYKESIEEALYITDYSTAITSRKTDENTLVDTIIVWYEPKVDTQHLFIQRFNTEIGLSQLLRLPLFSCIQCTTEGSEVDSEYITVPMMKAYKDVLFNYISTIEINTLIKFNKLSQDNQFYKMIESHIFPNVTRLIYDNEDSYVLKIVYNNNNNNNNNINNNNNNINNHNNNQRFIYIIDENNIEVLFPKHFLTMINTINMYPSCLNSEKFCSFLDDLAYNHSIHLELENSKIHCLSHAKELLENGIISLDDDYLKKFKLILYIDIEKSENKEHNYEYYYSESDEKEKKEKVERDYNGHDGDDWYSEDEDEYEYEDDEDEEEEEEEEEDEKEDHHIFFDDIHDIPIEEDMKNTLEKVFKSNGFQRLKTFVFYLEGASIEQLRWIDSLFTDNTFIHIDELTINLHYMMPQPESEYFHLIVSILKKMIPKASEITLFRQRTFDIIKQLINDGCFCNTTKLTIEIHDISPKSFFDIYTKENFHQLKNIEIRCDPKDCVSSFINTLCLYNNNNNFPSSAFINIDWCHDMCDFFKYDPQTSILRCKNTTDLSIEYIFIEKHELVSKLEEDIFMECIKENKFQNLKYINMKCDNKQFLSEVVDAIIAGKIPNIKEFICRARCIQEERIDFHKKQFQDSLFIQKNHIYYKFY
ncbi:hypothetical protein WA158_006784 [Blastocystis sp. Blastoise]